MNPRDYFALRKFYVFVIVGIRAISGCEKNKDGMKAKVMKIFIIISRSLGNFWVPFICILVSNLVFQFH